MPLEIWQPDPETGIWHVKGSIGGQRIRRSTRTDDRKAAKAAMRAFEREFWESRAAGKKKVVPFEDAVASYKRAGGDGRFTDPLVLHFAGWPVSDIMQGHVEDAARSLYPGRKPATWNRNVVTPVRAVLNHASERGWCAPVRFRVFKEEKVERRAVDRDWLDAFMAHAEPRLAALALFMFQTGARIGDALAVRWEEVQGRRATGETKTGRREYVLSRELMLRLEALRRVEPVSSEGPAVSSLVFGWQQRWSVYAPWKAVCERAGIEYVPPHQAGRHSFATEMIVRRKVDPHTTARLGGWASTRMLDRYAHPEGDEAVVDEVFGEPKVKEAKAE